MNSIHRQRKEVRRRPMRFMSSKQDYNLKKNMAIASSVERQDTLLEIV